MTQANNGRRRIQGYFLSDTLRALVLKEVLLPLRKALQAQATQCFCNPTCNNGDYGADGYTHLKMFIDNYGASVPHEDVLFFVQEFVRLDKAL